MIKRLFDISLSSILLLILLPFFLLIALIIFLYDFSNPIYSPNRVGKNDIEFIFIKFRSMTPDADISGIDSTSNNDTRITPIGSFIRKYKIDELSQIINVLLGDMSFVGPRPNVRRDVNLYSKEEKKLLSVKPGITDFSSIVFADEGDILEGHKDTDLTYNQLIRPWKSRLGIIYIENYSMSLDIKLLYLTALSLISREKALSQLCNILKKLKADPKVINAASRKEEFVPYPPPGLKKIVVSRSI